MSVAPNSVVEAVAPALRPTLNMQRVFDAPRAGEIVVAVAVTDSGRPLPRIGGLQVGEIKGVAPEIVAKLVEGLSLAGDLSDLDRHVQRIKTFAAAGMTENALCLHDEPEKSLHIIGKELLPKLKR